MGNSFIEFSTILLLYDWRLLMNQFFTPTKKTKTDKKTKVNNFTLDFGLYDSSKKKFTL